MSKLDPTTRTLIIERICTRAEAEGGLTNDLVGHYAALLEVSPRQVRRIVADGRRDTERPRLTISEKLYDDYFAAQGSCSRMHARLVAEGDWHYSLRQLQRAVERDLCKADRADARYGTKARREFEVYVRWEAEYRNQIWMVDIKELDNIVIPERGSKPKTVYLIAFLDAKTRAIVGYAVGLTKTAADVVLGLRDAVVIHDARGPFGGVPKTLMLDNALEHLAMEVLRAAEILGVHHQPTVPYSPWLRGKLERFFRTLRDEFSAEWSFYTHAPFRFDGSHHASLGEPMTLEELYERLVPWIDRYNRQRRHRALGGRTPEQAWLDDPTPIQLPDADAVRHMAIPSQMAITQKGGINFRNATYVAHEIAALGREEVEIRYSRNALGSIEVFLHGKWLCTAVRSDLVTTSLRGNVVRSRQASAARGTAAHEKRLLAEQVDSAARGARALRDLRPDGRGESGNDVMPERNANQPSRKNGHQKSTSRKRPRSQTSSTSRDVLDALAEFGIGGPLNRPLNQPLPTREHAITPLDESHEVVEAHDASHEQTRGR